MPLFTCFVKISMVLGAIEKLIFEQKNSDERNKMICFLTLVISAKLDKSIKIQLNTLFWFYLRPSYFLYIFW